MICTVQGNTPKNKITSDAKTLQKGVLVMLVSLIFAALILAAHYVQVQSLYSGVPSGDGAEEYDYR